MNTKIAKAYKSRHIEQDELRKRLDWTAGVSSTPGRKNSQANKKEYSLQPQSRAIDGAASYRPSIAIFELTNIL